jgi:hypothetical protein
MFGIDDPQILIAYLAAIISAIVCIWYGLWRWNKDGGE